MGGDIEGGVAHPDMFVFGDVGQDLCGLTLLDGDQLP